MARILTKLRIDEISSVDKGAGEGVRIVLMKRHDDTSHQRQHRKRLQRLFSNIDFRKAQLRHRSRH